jgi:hypothetical protein
VTTIDLTDGSFTTAPRPPSCESADPERFSCGVIGALADGTVLAGATERLSPELQETPGIVTTTGATRQVGGLVGDRLSPFEDLRVAGSVRTMPGTSDFWSGIALWVPGSGFDMGAESIVAGDPHEYRLRVRSGDGTLRRIIRVHADPVPVTQSLIDTHRAWADTAARAPDIARAYLAGLEPEGTVPFFGGLTIDPAERIWVRDYRPFWAFGPTPPDTWTILSPEGTPIGRLEGGAPGSILEIGEDYVLLLERDEFDVEYVRMRRIEMPRSGGG